MQTVIGWLWFPVEIFRTLSQIQTTVSQISSSTWLLWAFSDSLACQFLTYPHPQTPRNWLNLKGPSSGLWLLWWLYTSLLLHWSGRFTSNFGRDGNRIYVASWVGLNARLDVVYYLRAAETWLGLCRNQCACTYTVRLGMITIEEFQKQLLACRCWHAEKPYG